MNAYYRGFLILALAGCWAPAQAQEPVQVTVVGAPLAIVCGHGPSLAALNRAYVADKKRWATAARQYDKLLQGYPSAWAHYPYPILCSPANSMDVADPLYVGSVAATEYGDGPHHIPWTIPPDDFQLSTTPAASSPEAIPVPTANPTRSTEL